MMHFIMIGTDHLNLGMIVAAILKMVILHLLMKLKNRLEQIIVRSGEVSMSL